MGLLFPPSQLSHVTGAHSAPWSLLRFPRRSMLALPKSSLSMTFAISIVYLTTVTVSHRNQASCSEHCMNVADPANHSVLTSQSQSLSSLPLADEAAAEPARLPGQSDSRRLPMADAPLTRLNAGSVTMAGLPVVISAGGA
ncbi:hypothetical protein KC316_g48 [Hortaea werneckii]|nr:hypothetical protein KC316_g48 [Hortaea werneckii]